MVSVSRWWKTVVFVLATVLLSSVPVSAAQASLATVPVPYMGWNPYYANLGGANEATFEAVAESLKSTGLQNAGYNIFWLDYGWASGARDSSGNLIVNSTQWPGGMLAFTTWLHANGFLAGIYTDAGNSGCSNAGVGSYGHYSPGSTNPYSQDVNQFAAWGFDAIKVDFCGAGQEIANGQLPASDTPQSLYTQFSQAVANNTSDRAMILNVCNFWTPGQISSSPQEPTEANSSWNNFSWAPSLAQSWRTDTDVGFVGNVVFQNVLRNMTEDATNPQAAGPPSSTIPWGHWNDPDYLAPQFGMTDIQAQSQFSMWAMLAAPLMLGSDPRSLSSTTISMLENPRVIAIDQDSLGAQGTMIWHSGVGQQVWVKPLADGSRAVAFLNRASSAASITTNAAAVGLPKASAYALLNVWNNHPWTSKGSMSAYVQPDQVVLYRATAS